MNINKTFYNLTDVVLLLLSLIKCLPLPPSYMPWNGNEEEVSSFFQTMSCWLVNYINPCAHELSMTISCNPVLLSLSHSLHVHALIRTNDLQFRTLTNIFYSVVLSIPKNRQNIFIELIYRLLLLFFFLSHLFCLWWFCLCWNKLSRYVFFLVNSLPLHHLLSVCVCVCERRNRRGNTNIILCVCFF